MLDRLGFPALAFAVTVAYWPTWPDGALVPRWIVLSLFLPGLICWAEPLPRWLAAVGAAFLSWVAVSSLWAHSLNEAIYETWRMALLCGAFWLGWSCRDSRWFFAAFATGVSLSAGIALGQKAGIWDVAQATIGAPAGLFGNQNWMAEAAAVAAVAAFAFRGWMRWTLTILCAAAVVAAESRGAMLAVGAGYAALAWAAYGRRSLYWIATGAAAAAACAVLIAPEMLTNTGSLVRRWGWWTETVENLRWFGWGAGSFAGMFPLFGTIDNTRPEHAHNEFLNFAFELGLPSLLLFGVLGMAALGRAGIERAVLAAICVAGLFGFPFHLPATLLALGFCSGRLCRERGWIRILRRDGAVSHGGRHPHAGYRSAGSAA